MYTVFFYLSILIWFFYMARRMVQHLLMVQQNSYRPERFWRWLLVWGKGYARKLDLAAVAWVVFTLVVLPERWGALGYMVINLYLLLSWQRPLEKKPLVFTKRAKRLYWTSLLISLAVMIAVIPQKSPWGLLVLSLLTVGSALLMLVAALVMQPIESHINKGFMADAKSIIREMPRLTVCGVTGSYGKTSTKVVLGQVLSEEHHTLITPDSYNTPMGLTLAIRNMLKPTHEFFVAEMGARQPGDIQELCDLVQPKIGILTAIGRQHLETFKTVETVAETKFELIRALPADGLAVLNIDNEYIRERQNQAKCKVLTCSVSEESADFYSKDLAFTHQGMEFTICHPQGQVRCRTRLLGRHNVCNMLCAFAVAYHLGMAPDRIAAAFWKLSPVSHRLELKRGGAVTIIDDAFNSNPAGAASALEVLAAMPGGRKIIITPGMVELGTAEAAENFKFAQAAAASCDYIILVGRKHSKPLQEGLQAAHYPEDQYYVAADLTDARRRMQEVMRAGDYVLFENDLPDTYNE